MRVFLDANILFSAAKSSGAIRQILDQIPMRGHECVADEYVIAEARRNLEQKFPAALSDFENLLRTISRLASPPALSAPGLDLLLPEKDRPVSSRPADHFYTSWQIGNFGNDYAKSLGQSAVGAFESVLNAGYIFQISEEFSVQPDIQYIIRPGGFGQSANALVLGLQVTLNL